MAAAAVGQAGGGQGGPQVAMCPQEAQLGTMWIAAVSVAILLLHTIDEGRQIMRECAKELDCIAKQKPRLLFFAVVCPEAGGHLNGQLWGGGAPNNVVLIPMDGLLGELAGDSSLPIKQSYHLMHEIRQPLAAQSAHSVRQLRRYAGDAKHKASVYCRHK